ncbi:LysR family transcriptional regulator [Pseudidiomarina sp.]|uniref:LysR family transcriptional regulator n=1 Tax=Pseudidiomarina sp. TaxID=2081707 RepID=UPI003A96D64C
MLNRLADMAIYATVVEQQSFTGAAEHLGISKGAVSKAIKKLEQELNLRLLQRTTRTMTVTIEGRAFYEYCREMMTQAEAAEQHLGSLRDTPGGLIRITAPVTFGSVQIAPLIPELLQQYPEINVDLLLDDKRVDLVTQQVDIAIRCGQLESSSLIAKRLNDLPLVVVATPTFLAKHGTPTHPHELANLPCLSHSSHAVDRRWTFLENNQEITARIKGPMNANNNFALKQGLLASLGIAYLPRYQVTEQLANGQLVPLLEDYLPTPTPVHAVYRHRQHLSAAMRATLEFFTARL